MKLSGTFRDAALIDAVFWRSIRRDAFGVCVPLGKRAVFVVVRLRPKQRVYVSLPYMDRADAIKAAHRKWERRQVSP